MSRLTIIFTSDYQSWSMHQAKIGIVEDELIIASYIKSILEELHYIVPEPCKNYEDAIIMLETEKPDLVILDIQLAGEKDGVMVAEYIRKNIDIPFVFHTANSDVITVDRVKKVRPNAFLTKPFQKKDLLISVELALSNFSKQVTAKPAGNGDNFLIKDSFFIKDAQYFHKIKFDEVLYLESEGAYVTLFTEKKKYLVRGSIAQYLEKMSSKKFFRVHRSYAVNLDKVELINTSFLTIKDEKIPISKNFRDDLLTLMNIV
jgi:two-component system response regulator LytT